MDNTELGLLLKEYRTNKKLLQSDIALITNKSKSAISRYEKGEAEVPATVLIDFCNHFNLDINKFIGLKVPDSGINISNIHLKCLLEDASESCLAKLETYLEISNTLETYNKVALSSAPPVFEDSSTSYIYTHAKHIPLRGYVAAGTPIEAVENDLGTISSCSPEADFALIVNGNSMYPLINDGDYVFVKSCKQLNNGDIGVFYYNGSVTCKKYFKNDSILKLISINPTYEDFTFSLEDQKNEFLNFTIEGKVILSESQKKNQ